jgi:hypothetical protein
MRACTGGTNPVYGGAYAWGKTETVASFKDGASIVSISDRPRDRWIALIPGAHEGYVSWENFERNRRTGPLACDTKQFWLQRIREYLDGS